MHEVQHLLVVGVGVHRGHQALLDAEAVLKHLGYRRQAVGGAARVGDDLVLLRIEDPTVDAQHNRRAVRSGLSAERSGDDDVLRAGGEVGARLLHAAEHPGRLDDDVHAQVLPRQSGRVALGVHREFVPVDNQLAVLDLNRAAEASVVAVVLQQVGVDVEGREVIDRHHVNAFHLALHHRPQGEAADPAKAVNRHFQGHAKSSSYLR